MIMGPQPRIFYNGCIHTLDAANPRASVLAVRDGVILYAGNEAKKATRLLPGAQRTDLMGNTVVPGLHDSHQHFLMQGLRLSELDITEKPKHAILQAVAESARSRRDGEWILGRGWDNTLWENSEWPCKEDLDAVSPCNPVCLTRLDGHSIWVNSSALALAGIDRACADVPGGEILRRPCGELLGVLIDTPAFQVRSVVPPYTDAQKRDACRNAQQEMFRHGITSVGEAWITEHDFSLVRSLYEDQVLDIRLYGMLASRVDGKIVPSLNLPEPVSCLYGHRLSLRALKVVLDGSLGSRSAWLTREYADRPGHTGSHRYTDEELFGLLRPAVAAGFQICMHAIGDAAVLQAVRTFEELHRQNRGNWLSHRIEHFQTASPDTVDRALRLGIIPAMQTIHALADRKMAALRLPPPLLAVSYPWREVLDKGGVIANGSDSPMDGVNPFTGMYAAVSRTAFACCPVDANRLRMTRKEALLSYTLWAARAELAESFKGSLTVGKLADFAVLDRDILDCPEETLQDTQVLLTVLGGKTIYSASGME